jgi:hypothetical protein
MILLELIDSFYLSDLLEVTFLAFDSDAIGDVQRYVDYWQKCLLKTTLKLNLLSFSHTIFLKTQMNGYSMKNSTSDE